MPSTTDYTTPGTYTFTVPNNVTLVQIECWGGEGGDGGNDGSFGSTTGGDGGYVQGDLSVTPGEDLQVNVAAAGADDTTGGPGGRGEASDVRQNGTTLSDRVAVGAGGGAGGGGPRVQSSADGGVGGPSTGGDGGSSGAAGSEGETAPGGDGGTQSAGGAGGDTTTISDGGDGGSGSFGSGGGGASVGGDGGDGWYGGGGGAYEVDDNFDERYGGGGGGGSNYVGALSSTTSTGGTNTGDGQVTLTYTAEPSVTIDSLSETAEGEVRIQASSSAAYDSTGDWVVYRSVDGTQGTQIHTESTDADLDYTDTSAPTGDVVYYTVERVNDGGSDSAQSSLIVRAVTVTNLAVSAHDATSVDLDWDDNPGPDVDQFEIYRAEASGAGFVDYTQIDTSASSAYTDTGLENGERYYYTVLATSSGDSSYDSRYPGEVDQVTDLPAPTIDSTEDTA